MVLGWKRAGIWVRGWVRFFGEGDAGLAEKATRVGERRGGGSVWNWEEVWGGYGIGMVGMKRRGSRFWVERREKGWKVGFGFGVGRGLRFGEGMNEDG
ncbi:uncharacterized protein G2W53_032615 [Senna tora]|uniref:Uncharacterized protein n=1 Tax=Senna tora TaxID=362788 RepID=A0A834WBZ4_9FABA|nr:uncharacterized protein G2W53_032615 [Senna tora]